jgi:poly(ADP-ribose) glycohydrolase ARH3
MTIKRSLLYPREKAEGVLFGTFLGDAIGAFFDGWQVETIPPLDEAFLAAHPPKTYTDDTQMTISVFEEMAEHGTIDQRSLADRFLRRFSMSRGYGGGMLEVMELWKDGNPVETSARSLYDGLGSFGDGAAMRVAPIALFYGLDETEALIDEVRRCSIVTHTHPCGISGAIMQACGVLLALNDLPLEKWLFRFLALPLEGAFTVQLETMRACLARGCSLHESRLAIGNGAQAPEAVAAAVFSVMRNPGSFAEALLWAIGMGGDTDTIGAMAGAVAGARFGMGGIPEKWLERLENGREGKDFISALINRAAASRP